MTSREELVSLITSTAVAALNWNWMATGATPSPEATFRHVAEAIYEALEPDLRVSIEGPPCGLCGESFTHRHEPDYEPGAAS